MSDASYIELPPQPSHRAPFFRSWKGAVLLLFLAAVLVAGWFSWWLSEGKVSSSYARVDTVVYTVGTETEAKVEQILVSDGQAVSNGQPLAKIGAGQAQKTAQSEPAQAKLDATEESEKRVSALLARARAEEATFQKIHQDMVTAHVRAQLALRSTNPSYIGAYEEAARMEADARNRMNQAREDFEKISKTRALLDLEMARIHYEMARKKPQTRKSSQSSEQIQAQPTVPIPTQPAMPESEFLYAPVSGKIVGVGAVPGQTVHQGQPLFLIMPAGQASESWIQAWFPISARRMLKMGQKAIVKSGDLHLAGKVSAISPEAQYLPTANGQGQYAQYLPVRITINDPAEMAKLAPGTNVQCQIQTRYVIDQEIF